MALDNMAGLRQCRGQREGIRGVRAQGLCFTSVPVLKAYGPGRANHSWACTDPRPEPNQCWWGWCNGPALASLVLSSTVQPHKSCIVGLTRCQLAVNTCPSNTGGMKGHMQGRVKGWRRGWTEAEKERCRGRKKVACRISLSRRELEGKDS